jgi:hypothetical protein
MVQRVLRFAGVLCVALAGCRPETNVRAASAAADLDAPVRILVAGDSRGKPGFAEILDVARIKTLDCPLAALITPGDMDPIPTTLQQVVSVFGEPRSGTGETARGLVWYPVVGNHEAESPDAMAELRAYYGAHLGALTNPGPAGTRETTYSFDIGPVHVAVVNEYWDGNSAEGSDAAIRDAAVPALRDWLEQDLKLSRQPFKIVVGHEPAFPQVDQDFHEGRHADSSLNARAAERDAFWEVLERQGATMLLCGHTHRYSRFRPDGSNVWQVDGAQARNDASWKFDAFVVLTANRRMLRLQTYRHLHDRENWEVTDRLTLGSDGTVLPDDGGVCLPAMPASTGRPSRACTATSVGLGQRLVQLNAAPRAGRGL